MKKLTMMSELDNQFIIEVDSESKEIMDRLQVRGNEILRDKVEYEIKLLLTRIKALYQAINKKNIVVDISDDEL